MLSHIQSTSSMMEPNQSTKAYYACRNKVMHMHILSQWIIIKPSCYLQILLKQPALGSPGGTLLGVQWGGGGAVSDLQEESVSIWDRQLGRYRWFYILSYVCNSFDYAYGCLTFIYHTNWEVLVTISITEWKAGSNTAWWSCQEYIQTQCSIYILQSKKYTCSRFASLGYRPAGYCCRIVLVYHINSYTHDADHCQHTTKLRTIVKLRVTLDGYTQLSHWWLSMNTKRSSIQVKICTWCVLEIESWMMR